MELSFFHFFIDFNIIDFQEILFFYCEKKGFVQKWMGEWKHQFFGIDFKMGRSLIHFMLNSIHEAALPWMS